MTEETLHVKYELMVILDPNIGEEAASKEVEKLKGEIKEFEGKVSSDDFWGIRDLAYRIKKENRGYYAVLNFEIDPSKTKEFEKDLSLNQAVLRYLLIKTPNYYELKTFVDLQKEAEEISRKKAEIAKAKEEKKEQRRGGITPRPVIVRKEKPIEEKEEKKPISKEEKPVFKKEPKKEIVDEIEKEIEKERKEKVEDKKEEPKEPKLKLSDKSALEDFDAKLKSIIDDPDITL
jgi:small subunit ribosomal protein S6